jgi:hypothetical protein
VRRDRSSKRKKVSEREKIIVGIMSGLIKINLFTVHTKRKKVKLPIMFKKKKHP